MDTIALIDGENFDESLIKKFKDGKIFVFDLLSHKIIQNHNLEHFFADNLLNKKEREKIFEHVVSKLYWYQNQSFSNIPPFHFSACLHIGESYCHNFPIIFFLSPRIFLEEFCERAFIIFLWNFFGMMNLSTNKKNFN